MIALIAVLTLLLAAPAEAASTAQARRAVKRELRAEHEIRYPTVSCKRLTSVRFRCRWDGLSSRDVLNGNVDGWAGTARVRFYGRTPDVTLRVTRRGL